MQLYLGWGVALSEDSGMYTLRLVYIIITDLLIFSSPTEIL